MRSLSFKNCSYGNTLTAVLMELLGIEDQRDLKYLPYPFKGTVIRCTDNKAFDYIIKKEVVRVMEAM